MSDNNVTPPREMKFSASQGLYHLSGDATSGRIYDQLSKQLNLLKAMLLMTYAEHGEVFRLTNDDWQDNYMWGCADIADECIDLLNAHIEIAHNE